MKKQEKDVFYVNLEKRGGQKVTKEEFGSMIEQQGKAVYSFCYYLTGKKEDAEELYQDTMLKAMEKCAQLQMTGNPRSFLVGIALGIYRNYRKKWKNRQRIMPMDRESLLENENIEVGLCGEKEENQPEQNLLRKELFALIRRETALLPEKLRVVVHMFYTLEMSLEEIAQILHIPSGTVKSRLYKARKRLKERLEEHGYGKNVGF